MTQPNNNPTNFHSIEFTKTKEERERYNKWCVKFKVSSKWDDHEPSNQEFISNLSNAREELGWRI